MESAPPHPQPHALDAIDESDDEAWADASDPETSAAAAEVRASPAPASPAPQAASTAAPASQAAVPDSKAPPAGAAAAVDSSSGGGGLLGRMGGAVLGGLGKLAASVSREPKKEPTR